MSDDTRKDDRPCEDEESNGRREFLKQVGLVGGGALAMLAGLAADGEAAEILLRRPQMMELKVAPIQRHNEVFAKIKPSVEGAQLPAVQLRESMTAAKLQPADRVANVAVLQMEQRFAGMPDVGKHISTLFLLLSAGMEDIKGFNPRAAGNGCGSGCGYGCMSGVASGFICGNNCMSHGLEDQLQMRAGGFICGNNCAAPGLEALTIDVEGEMLGDVNFQALNMTEVAKSMENAANAYNQVFGK
ncbi:MAG: hypothetical protein GF393_02790 [Armatimonadia bacterium]|nr:hypothetical protein [Armatimonadia bacterium]